MKHARQNLSYQKNNTKNLANITRVISGVECSRLTLIVVGWFALAGQRNVVDVLADWRGCQQGDCARDVIEQCRCHVIILIPPTSHDIHIVILSGASIPHQP